MYIRDAGKPKTYLAVSLMVHIYIRDAGKPKTYLAVSLMVTFFFV